MKQIKEISIGDYFRVNRDSLCIKNGTIVEVRGIDADNVLENHIGSVFCRPLDKEQFDGSIWCDYLDPIPITAEILKKNGFTYYESNGSFILPTNISYGNWDVDVVLFNVTHEHKNNQLHIATPDDSITFLHLMECNHFHNLQQAFRLCGIMEVLDRFTYSQEQKNYE